MPLLASNEAALERAHREHEFELADFSTPVDLALTMLSAESRYPYPIVRPPPTFLGHNHCGVLTGIAGSALPGLMTLAATKFLLAGTSLRDQGQAQYAAAKVRSIRRLRPTSGHFHRGAGGPQAKVNY